MGEKESVICFTFVFMYYYFIVSLCSLIKLVNILRKYAASKQQHFKKD